MVKATMRRFQCSLVLFFSFFIYGNYALNCRIKHTASKENELMRIYSACQNKQNRKGQEDNENSNRESASPTNRRNSKNRFNGVKNIDEYDWTTKKSKTGGKDQTTENIDYDYVTEYVIESSTEGGYDRVNQRSAGPQGDDYSEDLIRYDSYRSLGKRSNRKEGRDKTETTSGQRSQYNPYTKNRTQREQELSSSESSKKAEDNACALHCFMETLKMTDDTGFPNRYLVMQAITKDIEDVELKEFLQESCEDCFDILAATKDEECEFSKNLLICLSDKGKANCDDWKNDGQNPSASISG